MPDALVAVDLDDTLYPELSYARSAVGAAAAELEAMLGRAGIHELAARLLEESFPRAGVLQRAMQSLGIEVSEADFDRVRRAMQAHRPRIEPFDDARPALERLRQHASVAVVSEGRSITQRAKLAALGIADLVDEVVITDELQPAAGKASGAPYRHLRARHAGTRRFIMIGDNPDKDATPAIAQGFEALLVRRPGLRYVHPCAVDLAGVPVFASLATAVEGVVRALADGSSI